MRFGLGRVFLEQSLSSLHAFGVAEFEESLGDGGVGEVHGGGDLGVGLAGEDAGFELVHGGHVAGEARGVGDVHFLEEGSAAGAGGEAEFAVDGLGVVVDEPAVDAGFVGDFGVAFLLEEIFLDELAAAVGGLDLVEGLGSF
jgi:hypothetical protein